MSWKPPRIGSQRQDRQELGQLIFEGMLSFLETASFVRLSLKMYGLTVRPMKSSIRAFIGIVRAFRERFTGRSCSSETSSVVIKILRIGQTFAKGGRGLVEWRRDFRA